MAIEMLQIDSVCDMRGTLDILYDYALAHVGLPYKWGGDDPINGYDCSGFVQECLRAVGRLPAGGDMTAQSLYEKFRAKHVTAPQLGHIIFYGDSLSKIHHVTLALSSELMIEAGGGGSKTNTLADAAAQNAYIRVRPIRSRSGLVAICNPS